MSLKYCFKLEDGRQICIPIPVKPLDLWSWLKERWIDLESIFRPGPTPWIADKSLKPEVKKDLVILATISKFTEQLNPTTRQQFSQALNNILTQIQLPEGTSIEFLESVIEEKDS